MNIKNFLTSLYFSVFTSKPKSNFTLIPFKESDYAVRLVPNTAMLNGFVDHILESIKQLYEANNQNPLPIEKVYVHFARWVYNESISGIFKTSDGLLWDLCLLRRDGNTYIYTNREESVQIAARLSVSPVYFTFKQYDLIFGRLYESGNITAVVDRVFVDIRVTVAVNMNMSMPLVLVCEGELDDLSVAADQFHFSLSGLKGNQVFYETVFNWLTTHFSTNVLPQLQELLSACVQAAVKTDGYLCRSLVLCQSCSFHTAGVVF